MTHRQEHVSGHEVALIRAFVMSPKRERLLTLLENPKARRKLLNYFYHLHDLDPRFAHRIARGDQSVDKIYCLLKEMGAPDGCYVMGNSDFDGQEVDLWYALVEIAVDPDGTFLSCIPGKLAYFGGEELYERYILER